MKHCEAIIILQLDKHEGEQELLWLSVRCNDYGPTFVCLTFLPETLLNKHIERPDFYRSFRALENATTSQQHGHLQLGNWPACQGWYALLLFFSKTKWVVELWQGFFVNFQELWPEYFWFRFSTSSLNGLISMSRWSLGDFSLGARENCKICMEVCLHISLWCWWYIEI